LQRARSRRVVYKQDIRRKCDQLCSLGVEVLVLSNSVSVIDEEVAIDDPTKITKRANNDFVAPARFRILFRQAHQPADPPRPFRALLRAGGERPRCRSRERGYQFPPSDVDWHGAPLRARAAWWKEGYHAASKRSSRLGAGCRCCAATGMTAHFDFACNQ